MKNRLKIHAVWGFAVAVLLLAQLGCSSKSSENAATTQPSPSPSVATALTSASPTPDATSTVATNPGAAPANPSGAGAAPAGSGAARRVQYSRGYVHCDLHCQGAFHKDRQGRRSLHGQSGAHHRRR